MKIEKLVINNFKKIKHLELGTGAQSFELKAPNQYGKSSIADAIAWVLTGKLHDGSSDIMSIKPKYNPSALVEVELEFSDGTSLKKTYQEKWVRTRGTTEEKLDGHETKCFINDLPIQVSKYDEELNELFGIEFNGKWKGNLIQLLIDPLHFGLKMEWKDRRTLVTDFVGDVTDYEVIAKNSDLKPLEPYLSKAKGKPEDVRKLINAELKNLKKEEEKLGNQIEVLEQTQTVSKEQFEEANHKLEEIEKQVDELKTKKYETEKDVIEAKKSKLNEIKEKVNESQSNDFRIHQESFAQVQKDIEKLQNQIHTERNVLHDLNEKFKNTKFEERQTILNKNSTSEELKLKETRVEKLRKEWRVINEKVFHTNDHLNCPNCGHDLNKDLVDEQQIQFEKDKKNRLQEINLEGGQVAKDSTQLQERLLELSTKGKDLQKDLEDLEVEISTQTEKVNLLVEQEKELKLSIPEFQESEETLRLMEEYDWLEKAPMTTNKNYQVEINELVESKKPLQEIINTYRSEQVNIKHAKELSNKLDKVIEQIAEAEYLGSLLSEFIKVKLELLNLRVEAVFGDIKFQMVESNIKEGSWNEVCWVLDGEVPYHYTNSASQITLGIRVAEAIRKHLGIEGLPYILDNAEQITDRDFTKYTEEQTISFVAHDEDIKHIPERPQQEHNLTV